MMACRRETADHCKFRRLGIRKRHKNSSLAMYQPRLFERLGKRFPSTRYQGSKAKLAHWTGAQIRELYLTTALNAFWWNGHG